MKNNKSKLAKIFRPAINLNLPGLRKAATRQVDGRSENGGFTLLLSLLVISVILSVGLGVSNIMIKELKLSGLGRESQVAFYAADTGVECFFFWEIKHPKLTKSAFEFDSAEINCAGKSIPLGKTVLGGLDTYKFILPLNNNSCVKVEVAKENKGTYIETTIKSKGYNMLDCDSTSSFKLERAIKMTIFKTLE